MVYEKIQIALNSITDYVADLEKKLKMKEKELQEKVSQTSLLSKEKDSAAEKLRKMEQDLAELSSVYEEIKDKQDYKINIQEVMKLYIILTEQVLDGSAHIKLLTLLHGAKQNMTKSELSKASGIRPAPTLRSIFDLRNNGLVEYNEETEQVKLLQRLFD